MQIYLPHFLEGLGLMIIDWSVWTPFVVSCTVCMGILRFCYFICLLDIIIGDSYTKLIGLYPVFHLKFLEFLQCEIQKILRWVTIHVKSTKVRRKLLGNAMSCKMFFGVEFQEFKEGDDRNILGCGAKNIWSRIDKILGVGLQKCF